MSRMMRHNTRYFDKPLEEFKNLYREIKDMSRTGQDSVSVVQRLRDEKYFVSKKANKSSNIYQEEDLNQLLQIIHPNIAYVEDKFIEYGGDNIIWIAEYCPCKLTSYFSYFICFYVDGNLMR